MLRNDSPATSYISWNGLVIVEQVDEKENIYVVEDGKSNKKYVYWDKANPYILYDSNEWITSTSDKKMIYINDYGKGTTVPQNEISLYYNDTGNGGSGRITGALLGKFEEIDGKFFNVNKDVNGLKEAIGSNTTETEGNSQSLISRLNKVEKDAEKTQETISQIDRTYSEDKEAQAIRDNLNTIIIDLGVALSEYEQSIDDIEDYSSITTNEKNKVIEKQNTLKNLLPTLNQYTETLIKKLNQNTANSTLVAKINNARDKITVSINNLNTNVNNSLSDNSILPGELTLILTSFSTASANIVEYKNILLDAVILGFGGQIATNILDITKTSKEFKQSMSDVVEEIDGETGLKYQITQNSTSINQTSRELSLNYAKYDKTTASLTVADGQIKLDAGKVLMTGTLTWDSLDDTAKENLKGEKADVSYVMLTGDQIFRYDLNGTVNTQSITLNTIVSGLEITKFTWRYKNQGSNTWNTIDTYESSYSLLHNSSIWNGKDSITIKVSVLNDQYYDEMTIVKLHDGENGKTVAIVGEQLFKYTYDNGTYNVYPTSITLTGIKNNIIATNSKWYYQLQEDSNWIYLPNSDGKTELTIQHNDSVLFQGNDIVKLKFTVNGYSDVMTIARLFDGEKGDQGDKGDNGYFVLLTNENHSVPCDEYGNYVASDLAQAKTEIHVFKGTQETSFSLSKTSKGCTSTYNTSTKTLSINTLTEKTATVTLSIKVEDGTVFKKIMTITKALKGDNGTGLNIIDILGSVNELPSSANPGDTYMIGENVYVWSGTLNKWSDPMPYQGEQGVKGEDGKDGLTPYLHIKYSNDGKTFTSNNGETPGKWLGQYTDYSEVDSKTFNDYTWKMIVGQDGDNGVAINLTNDSHTVPTDTNGENGIYTGCNSQIELFYGADKVTTGVTYSYKITNGIVGSWNTNGTYTVTNMTTDTGIVTLSAKYNGVTYSKEFTINKNKNGADAYTLNMSNDNHTFIADSSGKITVTQTTTTQITAYKGTKQVSVSIGTLPTVTGLTLGRSNDTVSISANTNTSALATSGVVKIPVTVDGKSFTLTFSYSKARSGANGTDGYTLLLTNEMHSFTANESGNIEKEQTATTNVKCWYGATEVTPTIGTLPTVSGLTLTKSGTTITIKANTGTALAPSGSFNIPVTVNGKNFIKIFSWAKVNNGKNGSSAQYVVVSGQQTFKYAKGATTPSPTSITLSVSKLNIPSSGKWQYKNSSGSWSDIVSGGAVQTGNTVIIYPDTGILSSTPIMVVRYYVSASIFDEISIAKLYDGNDSYTVLLTNEMHVFPAENNGNITTAWQTTTQVIAYKGTTAITPVIGTLPTVSGLTLTKSGTTITIKANVGSSLAVSGSFNIPITVDGKSFTKTFSWAKALKGATGDMTNVPKWISEWGGNVTTINNTSVLAPKIFAGTVSNSKPTGVALGTNVFGTSGTYSNISGLAGYNNGTKTYHFTTDGKVLIGKSATTGNRLYWDGTKLDIAVDSLSIGSSKVATESYVSDSINNMQIGGRNLALKTSADYSNWFTTFNNSTNCCVTVGKVLTKGLKVGDNIVIRLMYQHQNIVATSGYNPTAKLQGSGNITAWETGAFKTSPNISLTSNATDELIYSFTITSAHLQNSYWNMQIRHDYVKSGQVRWKLFKVEKGTHVTDWTPAPEDTETLIDDALYTLEEDLQGQIDGKIQTYYQSSDPSSSWTTSAIKNQHKGDIWYNSSTNITYRYTGSSWSKMSDADAISANALATTKAQVFTTTPSIPYRKGDLWITSLSGTGVVKTCTTTRTSGSYVASDWVEGLKYIDKNTATTVANSAVNGQSQLSIFNKLTNNGQNQGIYLQDNKIYINGEYMKAQSIDAQKLSVGDTNNYCDLVKGQNLWSQWGTAMWCDAGNSHCFWRTDTDVGYIPFANIKNNPFNVNDEIVFDFEHYTHVAGNYNIGVWYYANNTGNYVGAQTTTFYAKERSWDRHTVTIRLTNDLAKSAPFIALLINTNHNYTEIRNVSIRRRVSGALIVDGGIEARHIQTNSISSDKIQAGAITASKIQANSIDASKIAIGDFTNYSHLGEDTYSKLGFYRSVWNESNPYPVYCVSADYGLCRDRCLSLGSGSQTFSCKGGEKFNVQWTGGSCARHDNAYVNVNIGLYGRYANGDWWYQIPYGFTADSSVSWHFMDSEITIPDRAVTFGVYLQHTGWSGTWSGWTFVKDVVVRKKVGGSLIVDGSISADKISSNAITANKIAADAINGKTIVGATIKNSAGTIYMNNNEIACKASNGEWTTMNSSGLCHVDGNGTKPYHYMTAGVLIHLTSSYSYTYVQLPAMFKGKNFEMWWQIGNHEASQARSLSAVYVDCKDKNIWNPSCIVNLQIYTRGNSGGYTMDTGADGWVKIWCIY